MCSQPISVRKSGPPNAKLGNYVTDILDRQTSGHRPEDLDGLLRLGQSWSGNGQRPSCYGQIDGYINGEGVIHGAPRKGSTNVVAHRLHPGDFGMPESALSNLAYNIVNCDNRGVAVALDHELSKLHAAGEWQKTLTANGLDPDADAPLKSPVQHCGGG